MLGSATRIQFIQSDTIRIIINSRKNMEKKTTCTYRCPCFGEEGPCTAHKCQGDQTSEEEEELEEKESTSCIHLCYSQETQLSCLHSF